MPKNFANIYSSQNDSNSLEQKIYIKEETIRGVVEIPADEDFTFTTSGGSVNFTQPFEVSPHRSGRHNTSVIPGKTETSWTIPGLFNIDTTLGAASPLEIDPGLRVLFKSAFGDEDTTSGHLVYTTATDPDTTFTIFEVGDQWCKQAPGGFVEGMTLNFPGDGNANLEFSGSAKTSTFVGIDQSVVDNNGGNTVTINASNWRRFPVGSKVMIIEADGVTRSADTPNGSAREVTANNGAGLITVDGAVLADADGSSTPIYLAYYEPESPTAINDTQSGLKGSITIAGLTQDCVRSANLVLTNNHELINFCFGEEGLAGPLFTPGGRADFELTLELNMTSELLEFINGLADFVGENVVIILGDSTSRHLQVTMPKVQFPIPEVSVPDTGTIPVTFVGTCTQTALDAADEVTLEFL